MKYIYIAVFAIFVSCAEDPGVIEVMLVNHTSNELTSLNVLTAVGYDKCPDRGCGYRQFEDVMKDAESSFVVFDYFNTSCIAIGADEYLSAFTDCYLFNYLSNGQYRLYIFDDHYENYVERIDQ